MRELREALHHASPPPRGEEAASAVSKIVVVAAHRRRRRLATAVGGAAGVAIVLITVAPLRMPSDPGVTFAPSVATGSVPDPAPAAAAPVLLGDGTPVFVVRRLDGTAGVVAAVSTHLGGFVVWCPGSRTFADFPHDSFFDERGRWHTGPAPRDLRSADATQIESAGQPRRLLPGPLLEPSSRSMDADSRTTQGWCEGQPVAHGDPAFWEPRTVEEALARQGVFSLVTGSVTYGADGASFCPAESSTSSCEGVPVLSLFHRYPLQFMEGRREGQFLVKPHAGGFIDVIALPTVVRVED